MMEGGVMEIPAEMAENYINRRIKDLEFLESALDDENFLVCEQIGHRLKGSALTFGFEELQEVATQLETHAKQQDKESLASDVNEFRNWVDKLIN